VIDFSPSPAVAELSERLRAFVDDHVIPAEATAAEQQAAAGNVHAHPPVLEELKERAQRDGLWNLFLEAPDRDGDPALGQASYAPLAEISGRSHLAPEALNCNPPDSGNMELLAKFGTPEQQDRWLAPLLSGTIRSCFMMTEPEVASSDATNVRCSIVRDGDELVINGHKWWITGAAHPRCQLAMVMGKTDPDADPHLQQSIVLVPFDTPGLIIVRDLDVYGFHHREGHCEVRLDDVRVPVENVLGEVGAGFTIAQTRLGPGRLHHCLRAVGAAERALELLCARVDAREAFGGPLSQQGVVREWIADSRIAIDQARLLSLYAAWRMDEVGQQGARKEIAAAKVAAPAAALAVLDRAMQAHGAAGLCSDFPLAAMSAHLRTLRILDGPDEVHRRTIGSMELRERRAARRDSSH
jgi:acyl-CoA dehydrogenase